VAKGSVSWDRQELNVKRSADGGGLKEEAFSIRISEGKRGREKLLPGRSHPCEPSTRGATKQAQMGKEKRMW